MYDVTDDGGIEIKAFCSIAVILGSIASWLLRLVVGENVLFGENLMCRKEKWEYRQQHTHIHQQALYIQNH